MKHIIYIGAMFFGSTLSGIAMADCGGPGWNQVTNNANGNPNTQNLTNLLTGNTVCSSAGQGTQEEHHSGGALWDFKKGDGDPVDPRRPLGSWSVSGTGANTVVSYVYDAFGAPSQTGPFKVYRNGQNYDFCDSGNTSVGIFTVTNGINVGC